MLEDVEESPFTDPEQRLGFLVSFNRVSKPGCSQQQGNHCSWPEKVCFGANMAGSQETVPTGLPQSQHGRLSATKHPLGCPTANVAQSQGQSAQRECPQSHKTAF
ncbi:hypothetical protein MHYP_G00107220 [Metynnis hypsauchen]